MLSPKQRFTRIYNLNHWGDPESVSGCGSSLAMTEDIRRELPQLIRSLGITSVLDAPCGDFNWISSVLKECPDVTYFGVDIVDAVISKNQFENDSSRYRFWVADILRDKMPKVDLVIIRDFLIHLSFNDIRLALANLAASGSRYVLITNDRLHEHNSDIVTDRWRRLNFLIEPFSFPAPMMRLAENDLSLGREMVLWEFEDLKKSSLLTNSNHASHWRRPSSSTV